MCVAEWVLNPGLIKAKLANYVFLGVVLASKRAGFTAEMTKKQRTPDCKTAQDGQQAWNSHQDMIGMGHPFF